MACLTMLIAVSAKLLQGQQTELATEEPHPQLLVVVVVLSLELHRSQSHSNPRIKFLEFPTTGGKASGKVVCRAPNDLVKFHNGRLVEIAVAFSYLLDFRLKFEHGFVTHAP